MKKQVETEVARVGGQHTPVPWLERGTQFFHQLNPGGRRLLVGEVFRDVGAQSAIENVAFICRAVNSHADLVAALRECERAIGDSHANMSAEEIDEHWQDQNLRDAAIKARAAIARAEGRV